MSQPAASRSLSEIEADVGAPLFRRHPKGMQPTQQGEAFVRNARTALTALSNLETEVIGLNDGVLGDVRVGSVTGPAVQCLVPALLKIRDTAPNLEATFEVAPSSDLLRGVARGEYDFVLARLPAEYDARDYHILPARFEEVSMVVRHTHPLAARSKLKLEDLQMAHWVIQERGSPIREAVDGAYIAAGLQPPREITNSSSLLVMLAFLEQSDSVAPLTHEVASLLTRELIGANLRVLNVEQQIAVSPYFIIRRRDHELSRGAARVLDEVLKLL